MATPQIAKLDSTTTKLQFIVVSSQPGKSKTGVNFGILQPNKSVLTFHFYPKISVQASSNVTVNSVANGGINVINAKLQPTKVSIKDALFSEVGDISHLKQAQRLEQSSKGIFSVADSIKFLKQLLFIYKAQVGGNSSFLGVPLAVQIKGASIPSFGEMFKGIVTSLNIDVLLYGTNIWGDKNQPIQALIDIELIEINPVSLENVNLFKKK